MRGKTQQIGIRVPLSLLKRLDRYVRQLQQEAPWANATRTDAARALLTRGLDDVEAEGRKVSPRAKKGRVGRAAR